MHRGYPLECWTQNDVAMGVKGLSWCPDELRVLLAAHRIDGAALIELTESDLRFDFFITTRREVQAVLDGIADLRCKAARAEPPDRDCTAIAAPSPAATPTALPEGSDEAKPTSPCVDTTDTATRPEEVFLAERACEMLLSRIGDKAIGSQVKWQSALKKQLRELRDREGSAEAVEYLSKEIDSIQAVLSSDLLSSRPPASEVPGATPRDWETVREEEEQAVPEEVPENETVADEAAGDSEGGVPWEEFCSRHPSQRGELTINGDQLSIDAVVHSKGDDPRQHRREYKQQAKRRNWMRTNGVLASRKRGEVWQPGLLQAEQRRAALEELFESWDKSESIEGMCKGTVHGPNLLTALSSFFCWKTPECDAVATEHQLCVDQCGNVTKDEFIRFVRSVTWLLPPMEFNTLCIFIRTELVSYIEEIQETRRRRRDLVQLFDIWDASGNGMIPTSKVTPVVDHLNATSNLEGACAGWVLPHPPRGTLTRETFVGCALGVSSQQMALLTLYTTLHVTRHWFRFFILVMHAALGCARVAEGTSQRRWLETSCRDLTPAAFESFAARAVRAVVGSLSLHSKAPCLDTADVRAATALAGGRTAIVFVGKQCNPSVAVEKYALQCGQQLVVSSVRSARDVEPAMAALKKAVQRGMWCLLEGNPQYGGLTDFVRQVSTYVTCVEQWALHRRFVLLLHLPSYTAGDLPPTLQRDAVVVSLGNSSGYFTASSEQYIIKAGMFNSEKQWR